MPIKFLLKNIEFSFIIHSVKIINRQAKGQKGNRKMKKYSYVHVVAFKDKKTGTIIITREYKTDDEYFEIMDSIDVNAWEMIFDKITR